MSEVKSDLKMQRTSFSEEELLRIKSAVTGGAEFTCRMSIGLAVQLVEEGLSSSNTTSVLFEIDHLERGVKTSTKEAEPFRHGRLKSFWHKHFYTAENAWRNIGERWGVARGGGNGDLDRMINDVAIAHGNEPERWPGMMAHRFADGLRERSEAGRITGHWIVFGRHCGANYYLRLATHQQGSDGDWLYKTMKQESGAEFPFLFAD